MTYELHYAGLNETEIEVFKLRDEIDLALVLGHCINTNDRVYLVSINDEVFVCDNIRVAVFFINKFKSVMRVEFSDNEDMNNFDPNKELPAKKVFIQEYDSYEEAYKVALDMKEESPLCYGK